MANFWTTKSGTVLTTLEERVTTTYALPIDSTYLPLSSNNMSIKVIAGTVPSGLRLNGANLEGTPFEVKTNTSYTFVIRAEQYGVIDDRTYTCLLYTSPSPRDS